MKQYLYHTRRWLISRQVMEAGDKGCEWAAAMRVLTGVPSTFPSAAT
jgi:hypothetical protein